MAARARSTRPRCRSHRHRASSGKADSLDCGLLLQRPRDLVDGTGSDLLFEGAGSQGGADRLDLARRVAGAQNAFRNRAHPIGWESSLLDLTKEASACVLKREAAKPGPEAHSLTSTQSSSRETYTSHRSTPPDVDRSFAGANLHASHDSSRCLVQNHLSGNTRPRSLLFQHNVLAQEDRRADSHGINSGGFRPWVLSHRWLCCTTRLGSCPLHVSGLS